MEDLQTSETVSMPRIILEPLIYVEWIIGMHVISICLKVVGEHAVFTLITDVISTKLPIHDTSRAPKCVGVVPKKFGGRLAVNGIQLGTQQLIITVVAVAEPRLKHWLLEVQTPSGNTLGFKPVLPPPPPPPPPLHEKMLKRAHLRNL